MTATPTKLRDGTWGARVQGTVQSGDRITITTRAGKSWTAVIARVVWTGQGVSLVATGSAPRPQAQQRNRQTGSSCCPTGYTWADHHACDCDC